MDMRQDRSETWRRSLALLLGASLLAACATPQMQGQWRDPRLGERPMQDRAVLVVCRGLDPTLERICEDRLAADTQAAGIRVVRPDLPRDASLDPAPNDALLAAARAAGAAAVLSMVLERSYPPPPPGGSVGVGVAGGSGGWGGSSGAIGITLPLGSLAPALVSGASLADAVTGRLVWTGRARGSGAANEVAQVGELTRLTAEALKGSGLF